MIDKDREGSYVGYREAYHLLLYGKERKIELLEWWNEYRVHDGKFKPDCTFDAACDFYDVNKGDEGSYEKIVKLIKLE